MIKFLLSIFIIFSISQKISAASIAVVDIEVLIDNNLQYQNTIKELENEQKQYSSILNSRELRLEKLLQNINESKILLNSNEIDKLINEYNNEYNLFSLEVERFNSHYKEQIFLIRKKILEEIIVLVENYANRNKIEIVLDTNNYIIASNELNITNIIQKNLNEINFIFEINDFETD